jgi:uncharacterized membrane protein
MHETNDKDKLSSFRWMLVVLSGLTMIIGNMTSLSSTANIITFCIMVVFAWTHGAKQYGLINMGIWFIITFVVSTFFEGLSIHTGFPFGNYHYTNNGPQIWDVPVMIPVIYFGLAYTSWNVAQVLLGINGRKILGMDKVLLPLTAAIIMSMWDLVTDPQASTISQSWIWENGGTYFGVPISNFFGWVFVVYTFMQIYTLWIISHQKSDEEKIEKKPIIFWLESVFVYLGLGVGIVVAGFFNNQNIEIHTSMAMLSFFTIVVISGLSMRRLIKRQ